MVKRISPRTAVAGVGTLAAMGVQVLGFQIPGPKWLGWILIAIFGVATVVSFLRGATSETPVAAEPLAVHPPGSTTLGAYNGGEIISKNVDSTADRVAHADGAGSRIETDRVKHRPRRDRGE